MLIIVVPYCVPMDHNSRIVNSGDSCFICLFVRNPATEQIEFSAIYSGAWRQFPRRLASLLPESLLPKIPFMRIGLFEEGGRFPRKMKAVDD